MNWYRASRIIHPVKWRSSILCNIQTKAIFVLQLMKPCLAKSSQHFRVAIFSYKASISVPEYYSKLWNLNPIQLIMIDNDTLCSILESTISTILYNNAFKIDTTKPFKLLYLSISVPMTNHYVVMTWNPSSILIISQERDHYKLLE